MNTSIKNHLNIDDDYDDEGNLIDPIEALRDRAEAFSKTFINAKYEKGEGQQFLIKLCDVFELDSVRNMSLEHRVQKSSGKGMEFVDGFFPGLLLVEMKSKGKDLQAAYEQAKGYIKLLKNPEEMPRYILVCDFQTFNIYDLEATTETFEAIQPVVFELADLRHHVDTTLAFLSTYERVYQDVQVRITIRAANTLTVLHDALKTARYSPKDMQSFLVRILFCLFAEDTDLFNDLDKQHEPHFTPQPFQDLVQNAFSNGQYLGDAINRMFTRLNTPPEQRTDTGVAFTLLSADEQAVYYFPYVNGDLFAVAISPANFNAQTRQALLKCCDTDWSLISPDIFGTMFQNLMHWDDEAAGNKGGKRRDFGAHYTSERNILRAIRPLFIDELNESLKNARAESNLTQRKKLLLTLYETLPTLNILDPACGCGNFLVVAYRELRRIEFELIADLFTGKDGQSKGLLDIQNTAKVNVGQFYGIELDPTAAEIATVAMWLTDHQLNRQAAERFGRARPSIPLNISAHIAKGQNALQLDWETLLPAAQCSYIVGNPPFLGYKQQSKEQKTDTALVFKDYKKYKVLDYVCSWYVKAVAQMKRNPAIKAAFVSTNSITQGEQVAVLWQPLVQAGVHIHFAHRTFKWSNEGSSVAAVHCVIIGFGMTKPKKCTLWDYSANISTTKEVKPKRTRRINAYLVDAPHVWITKLRKPLCTAPEMNYGNEPREGGYLILTNEEKEKELLLNPDLVKFMKKFVSADDFINGKNRWCYWLKNTNKEDYSSNNTLKERLIKVSQFRSASLQLAAHLAASTPEVFVSIRQPKSNYLLIPIVSSEKRLYIPTAYVSKNIIASNACFTIPNATIYHFGILNSTMHNAWLRAVGGRLKSDYRYSNTIVYNNFPWPKNVSAEDTKALEAAGQAILDARLKHQDKSLAWLYNPETMPKNLQNAHDDLDDVVDDAYGYSGSEDDAARVAFLFERYQQLTTLLPQEDDETEEKMLKPVKSKTKKQAKTTAKPKI